MGGDRKETDEKEKIFDFLNWNLRHSIYVL